MNSQSTRAIADVLVPIWQRVLRCSSVDPNDNFFDLGGDSLLAVELFTEIARVYGREFPAVVIYQAPTIAELAALLEKHNAPGFPPLVVLRDGTRLPAVFVTHGLGGSVVDFFQVIRHLKTDHPIYGMQAKGIDGVERPFKRIEDMADHYLSAVTTVQPRGPYLLVGFSLGGLVVLEMAQRLLENSEKIGLLALLDSYPHSSRLSWALRMRLGMQLFRRHLSIAKSLPPGRVVSYFLRRSERRSHVPGDASGRLRYPFPAAQTSGTQLVREAAYAALASYRPPLYAGQVKFVRAGTPTDFPKDPKAVWRKFIPNLEVETVPGDHIGIMTTHAPALARVLSTYLDEAHRMIS